MIGGRRYTPLKRFLDFVAALLAIVLLSPVFAAVAIAVRRGLGSPVLFRQQRPGLHGRPFTLYKFRTMREASDADGRPLSDAERLTPLGLRLRKYSLDEIPEFFNVLRGDMSIVGPRPLLMQYLQHYSPHQMRRHEVRPGITGLAQVSGRNDIPWHEKLQLDVEYVDRMSLALDLRILFRTVQIVATGTGVSKSGFETTDLFTGQQGPEDDTGRLRGDRR